MLRHGLLIDEKRYVFRKILYSIFILSIERSDETGREIQLPQSNYPTRHREMANLTCQIGKLNVLSWAMRHAKIIDEMGHFLS